MFKNFHFRLKYINFRLLFLVIVLTVIGIIVIGSAVPGAGYQSKQIFGLAISLVLMTIFALIDYNWILKFYWVIYGVCNLFLLAVLKFGKSVNGATRWIAITDSIRVQPSEFAKIMMILFWAGFIGKNPSMLKKWKNFFIVLAISAVPLLLIVKEPDLSSTILFVGLFVVTLFIAGFSYKKFGIILAIIVPILAGLIIYIQVVPPPANKIIRKYQYERIMAYLNPDEYDAGRYQQDNSVMAIGSGQLTGKGLYNNDADSVKNGNYIIEPQTDFIMAIIGEELGFAGALVILTFLILIMIECVITGARAPDMPGRLICFGMAAIIVFQTFINVGVATELLPNTGIPLPFVSYGLSSLVTMYAGIGLVLNVRIRKKMSLDSAEGKINLNFQS